MMHEVDPLPVSVLESASINVNPDVDLDAAELVPEVVPPELETQTDEEDKRGC